jgi:4-hydroxy-tetrahydrodipicolinate reductase
MSKLKLSIFGVTGRMGQEVKSLASKDKSVQVVSLEDQPAVVIDFSSPKGLLEIAHWCSKHKVPLVSGTTGLSSIQKKKLKSLVQSIPVLCSPNFSLGLNAMVRSTQSFLESAIPTKVAIEEIHHKNKKDNPSGTAKLLQSIIKEKASKKTKVLQPVGLRVGNVFGLHKVMFFLDGELISFVHEARDRRIFAKGAVEVAKWIVRQKAGYYKMAEFIEGTGQ